MFTAEQIEKIVDAELATLLWSEYRVNPEGDDMGGFDADYEVGDATPELVKALCDELEQLDADNYDFYAASQLADFERVITVYKLQFGSTWQERFGHDMALTRNGHGGGFWDRGLPGDVGDVLTDWAKSLGSLRVFDDFVEENAAEWAGMFHAE